jgi:hypothetical protein
MVPVEEQAHAKTTWYGSSGVAGFMPRLHGMVPVEEQDSCLDYMVWFLWRSRIHAQTTWYSSCVGDGSCPDYMVWFLWRSRLMPRLHGMVPVEEQDSCPDYMAWFLWSSRIHA